MEVGVCRLLNRSSNLAAIRELFRLVSWLGNGWAWYGLIVAVALQSGRDGVLPALHMLITGAVGVGVYKLIKQYAVRERPFISHSVITCACAPLDRYSFPSGHTLHAVSFSMLLSHYSPAWAGALVGLTLLVALSRVILGLHYPSDVAVGAALGGGLASASLRLAELLSA